MDPQGVPATAGSIPLSEALGSLRQQLRVAMDDASTEQLRFGLTSVELELIVAITADSGWRVLPLDATPTTQPQTLQRLRLTLHPRLAGIRAGDEIEVGSTGTWDDEHDERPLSAPDRGTSR